MVRVSTRSVSALGREAEAGLCFGEETLSAHASCASSARVISYDFEINVNRQIKLWVKVGYSASYVRTTLLPVGKSSEIFLVPLTFHTMILRIKYEALSGKKTRGKRVIITHEAPLST